MAEARLPRQGPEPRGGPSHTLAPASPLGARLPAPCHVGASLLPPLTLTPLTTGQQLRFQGRARLQLPAARGVPRTLTRESSLARPHQTGSRSRESPEMSSNDSSLMAGIIYYSQEKYFRHVQQAAAVGLEKFSNDSVLQFFKAYGVFREERIQDAISNLESIRSHPDVSLCSTMALIYAHKSCETIDQEAIQELQSSLKETRKKASGTALYYASLFLWLMGHHDRAREYIDCVLRLSSTSSEAYVLRGWVDLTSDKPHTVKKSIKYLEQGTQDAQDVLGLMGKATYYMTQQNYSGALEVVNQITVASGGFLPALVLKMRLFLARQDWEQTIEIGLRILEKDKSNIDACQILAMHELAREGNMTTAADHVRNLIKALEIREPQNPSLHLKKILVVSRLCGRNQVILRLVCSFIERTFMATPLYAHMATELGYLFILQDQVKEASLWYSEAMKLDDSSVAALTGSIWCQILDGHLQEAEHQLEFLKEVQQSLGKSEVLVFLQALLASRKHKGEQEATALLKEAVELHFSSMQGLPLGAEYFEKLDPLFLVCIAREYLFFCPKQPRSPGQILSPLLKQVTVILNPVVKAAPALLDPLYVMAQVKYLSGELENAQSTLQRCLELDPTSADAHLLMSQIYLAQGNFSMCSHCLELGVSHNFQVRDHPLYHFIKARALNKSGDYPEAIKTLQMIIKLPTLRMEESKKLRGPSMQPSERVSILLELVDALRMNGELHEATKVMQDAINEFSGTPEEIRITIANVDLALSKGNVDMALSVLRNITPQQPCYTEAKEKMASIYLHTRKDSRLYIGCYRELCEHLPGPHTSLLLGDAFINIQEPEKALEVYDEAYRKNPHDASLVSRIGQAYVKTHQYLKAMNYYEAAQKISGQDFLCCDLAELLLKLKKFIKAEKVLTQALEHDFVKDIPSMMNDVKCLLLLAKVYKSHKKQDVLETLNKARDLQSRILKRVPMEQPEMIASQKQLAASICIQFGEHYLEEKDYAKAVRSYKDALSYSPTDNKVMLELAQLYLLQGHLDLCEQHCAILLQTEKNHEIASMMMADLMFRKQEYEAAVHLYHQILEKAPDNFRILNKLIDLLRRSGKLEDAPAYFELAKKLSSRVLLEPGFNYCTGIYCWHIGHPKEAMKFLNKARKDSTWGQSATYYMVQICLNPDNEIVGGKAFENLVSESKKESEQQEGVRTAEKLLLEFYPHTAWGQTQLQLLQGLCLLATREKANVEAALGTFINMAQAEKDSVPALLAVAQAYMLLKQIPKARTQLKRLAKAPWALAEAEDLEKSWLLLADIYCQGGKFDLATELLRRCVQYNKSCCKAYEYMGFIMEKEQSYKDAATNYELAWKYSHHANPAIGFKLAFNYLKDKRFVEAIDVCHHVLGEHPNYPKIREEILEKAQGSLRP
ncbi:PREDICTED: tetratricopeptide repeat protein 21A isoform X2 [Hipposideros armiger]|uniref:Tetratricopeptide repeat protein 21A isoform X2 n=1 Tax=Hipposideros armiger TaxID=186990 RepID=A0A8B7SZP7_HIPAR|nr:PREDICTED: tetratricopeptide repeat protein 21A isoform X2 [Hipposideros armiger]